MTADVHLIATEANAPVAAVCRTLGVPRSTAYARRARKPSQRARETAALDVAVKAVHAESGRHYGEPQGASGASPGRLSSQQEAGR